jgi:predicted nucleic acid-binding Zn ribbon protein
MTGPIFLPITIRRSQKCSRCGLRFPKSEAQCTHCANLSDREVIALKERRQKERLGNANLANLFYFIAALLAVGFILSLF